MKHTIPIMLIVAVALSGCGTVKEKSAPCKRPANLTAFVEDPRDDCGPMQSVNADPWAVLLAIEDAEAQ